jgi:hypothetical protein
MSTLLQVLRTTIVQNDTDPDDGTFGRSYRWTTTTGPYTTRTKNNGALPERGRFFNAGEITMGMYMTHPYSGLGNSRYMGRHFNMHDEPVSGYVWGDVSPAAMEVQRADNPGHGPNGGPIEYTLEYTSGCAGAGSFNSTALPIAYDEDNYVFFEIKWQADCTGYLKIWVTNGSRPSSLGPAINISGVKTLHPSPYFPGVWVWVGGYINTGYTSGGSAYIDHSLDMWGYSWAEAYADTPEIVSQWGSNLSHAEPVGTTDITSWIIPDEIVTAIGGGSPGGGGTGGGGGGGSPGGGPSGVGTFADDFENGLSQWTLPSDSANITRTTQIANYGIYSVRCDPELGDGQMTAIPPEIGDLDRWYYMTLALNVPDWEDLYSALVEPVVMGFTGDQISLRQVYLSPSGSSGGDICWRNEDDSPYVIASLDEGQWLSVTFGMYVSADGMTIRRRCIAGGTDTGVVTDVLGAAIAAPDGIALLDYGASSS